MQCCFRHVLPIYRFQRATLIERSRRRDYRAQKERQTFSEYVSLYCLVALLGRARCLVENSHIACGLHTLCGPRRTRPTYELVSAVSSMRTRLYDIPFCRLSYSDTFRLSKFLAWSCVLVTLMSTENQELSPFYVHFARQTSAGGANV